MTFVFFSSLLLSITAWSKNVHLNIQHRGNTLLIEQKITQKPEEIEPMIEFRLHRDVTLKNSSIAPLSQQVEGDYILYRFLGREQYDFTLVRNLNSELVSVLNPNFGAIQKTTSSQNLVLQTNQQWRFDEEAAWYMQEPTNQAKNHFSIDFSSESQTELIHSATGHPQDKIAGFLGHFKKYQKVSNSGVRLNLFLVQSDELLAKTVLETLEKYLIHYEKELGDYPYDEFSVVENLEETGFAFPRMTWMGSQLLRFPFILTTSLPHELLHSWWGNGVFVNTEFGNWCEGLTTYLADYAFQPSEKAKADYRLKALLEYENYVKSGHEIPLSDFISRGEDRSLQAIGYSKATLVFLMLERQLGRSLFSKLLKDFYQAHKYSHASFKDFFAMAEKVSGQKLEYFFKTWILQKGSVNLAYKSVRKIKTKSNTWVIEGQLQASEALLAFKSLPAVLEFSMGSAQSVNLPLNSDLSFTWTSEQEPMSLWLDPDFQLFRKLKLEEKPSTLSETYGHSEIAVVIAKETSINQAVVEALKNLKKFSVQMITPDQVDFKSGQAYIFVNPVGENLVLAEKMRVQGVNFQDGYTLQGQKFSSLKNAALASFKIESSPILVIGVDESSNISRIVQRSTRYGSQSYVVLSESAALLQGLWQGHESELKYRF